VVVTAAQPRGAPGSASGDRYLQLAENSRSRPSPAMSIVEKLS